MNPTERKSCTVWSFCRSSQMLPKRLFFCWILLYCVRWILTKLEAHIWIPDRPVIEWILPFLFSVWKRWSTLNTYCEFYFQNQFGNSRNRDLNIVDKSNFVFKNRVQKSCSKIVSKFQTMVIRIRKSSVLPPRDLCNTYCKYSEFCFQNIARSS